ncbi:type VI secretion system ImpA family N-terminal domain-containing protein, partial [Yersinia pestis]
PPQINWHHISEQANKLLEQCFDLRVMLWFIRANIHIKGISALYDGFMRINAQTQDTDVVIYPQSEEPPLN